jgi:hypothetical protein
MTIVAKGLVGKGGFMLKGKKTYAAAAVMIVVAAGSVLLGDLPLNEGIQRGIEGLAIIFLRMGIKIPS